MRAPPNSEQRANGIMKLRRFAKRLRYRCGRCEDAEGAKRAQCPNGNTPAVARPPRPCAIHAKTGARCQTLRSNYTPNTFITSPPIVPERSLPQWYSMTSSSMETRLPAASSPIRGGGASSSATMTRRDAASPCVARPLDDLLHEHPAVVEVCVRRLGRDLLHAASEVVVAVGPRFFLQMLSLVSGSHFLPASNFHPIIANCTT